MNWNRVIHTIGMSLQTSGQKRAAYLKKHKIDNSYGIDNTALSFYADNFDMDLLTPSDEYVFTIKQTDWDKIYKKQMDILALDLLRLQILQQFLYLAIGHRYYWDNLN